MANGAAVRKAVWGAAAHAGTMSYKRGAAAVLGQCNADTTQRFAHAPGSWQAGSSCAACLCMRWWVRGRPRGSSPAGQGRRAGTRSSWAGRRHTRRYLHTEKQKTWQDTQLSQQTNGATSHLRQRGAAHEGLAAVLAPAAEEGGHPREGAGAVHICEVAAAPQRRGVGICCRRRQGCQRRGCRGLGRANGEGCGGQGVALRCYSSRQRCAATPPTHSICTAGIPLLALTAPAALRGSCRKGLASGAAPATRMPPLGGGGVS